MAERVEAEKGTGSNMKIDMLIVLMVGMMIGSNLTIVILAFLGANHEEDRISKGDRED